MKNLKENIINLSDDLFEKIVEIRRHIHKNPELSFCEYETSNYIKSILNTNNIEYDDTLCETSVIAIIDGVEEGDTIGLRADIDALPIIENNNVEYKSQNIGVMHACGHDAHTASLLGTALMLNRLREHIKGRIVLVFQAAEEKNPGGAKILVDNGLIEKYNIKNMLGQHTLPEVETGIFLFGKGLQMASTDELYITMLGKGGHAALPQFRSDTVLATVDFIKSVEIFQTSIKNEYPFIIAFGKLEAKGAVNVIPDTSIIHGTMRTFDEDLRKNIQEQLSIIANQSAEKYSCEAKFEISHGYPSLINDDILTNQLTTFASEFVGESKIDKMQLRMTAEDFAYYSRKVPSCFYRFGVKGNGKGCVNLHNPAFDIDEEALRQSSRMMTWLAINLLQSR